MVNKFALTLPNHLQEISNKIKSGQPYVVRKPWGWKDRGEDGLGVGEEWLALNDYYCYKRLYIRAGTETSTQYHERKFETNYIVEGTAQIWTGNRPHGMEMRLASDGFFIDVAPPTWHKVVAVTDLILMEASTPDVDDVVRYNDKWGRGDGRIEGEHKNTKWYK